MLLVILGATLYLLTQVTHLLEVSDSPSSADAIVILLGGDRPERLQVAADLWIRGYAPSVFFGTGFNQRTGFFPPRYAWQDAGTRYQNQLHNLGVPRHSMTLIDTPTIHDTESELFTISHVLRIKGVRHVILVTSSSHSFRSRTIWQRIAPDILVTVIPAPDPVITEWWSSRRGISTIAHELLGLCKEGARRMGLMEALAFSETAAVAATNKN